MHIDNGLLKGDGSEKPKHFVRQCELPVQALGSFVVCARSRFFSLVQAKVHMHAVGLDLSKPRVNRALALGDPLETGMNFGASPLLIPHIFCVTAWPQIVATVVERVPIFVVNDYGRIGHTENDPVQLLRVSPGNGPCPSRTSMGVPRRIIKQVAVFGGEEANKASSEIREDVITTRTHFDGSKRPVQSRNSFGRDAAARRRVSRSQLGYGGRCELPARACAPPSRVTYVLDRSQAPKRLADNVDSWFPHAVEIIATTQRVN